MTRLAFPLPSPDRVLVTFLPRSRAAFIRSLWGQGCSMDEVTAYLRITVGEVRRTLLFVPRSKVRL